jgi:hypothetical protein
MAKYILDDGDAQFLRMLKAAYDNGELRFSMSQPKRQTWQAHGGEFGKANASISGTTQGSSTCSSGTVTVWTFTNSTNSMAATTETVTAFNQSTVAVSTGRMLQLKRHIRTGNWLIDFESCTRWSSRLSSQDALAVA